MTQLERDAHILAAHRDYADALNAVDIASAELATAQELKASAEARLRQLARIEVDSE